MQHHYHHRRSHHHHHQHLHHRPHHHHRPHQHRRQYRATVRTPPRQSRPMHCPCRSHPLSATKQTSHRHLQNTRISRTRIDVGVMVIGGGRASVAGCSRIRGWPARSSPSAGGRTRTALMRAAVWIRSVVRMPRRRCVALPSTLSETVSLMAAEAAENSRERDRCDSRTRTPKHCCCKTNTRWAVIAMAVQVAGPWVTPMRMRMILNSTVRARTTKTTMSLTATMKLWTMLMRDRIRSSNVRTLTRVTVVTAAAALANPAWCPPRIDCWTTRTTTAANRRRLRRSRSRRRRRPRH